MYKLRETETLHHLLYILWDRTATLRFAKPLPIVCLHQEPLALAGAKDTRALRTGEEA